MRVASPALRVVRLWVLLSALGVAPHARAVPITLVNVDAANVGFNDPTPTAPVGGNEGATLGEQRWNAVSAGVALWEDALGGTVEVIVEVSFAPVPEIGCANGFLTLAQAGSVGYVVNTAENTVYPVALANQLAGEDLYEDEADILVQFNDALGDPERCEGEDAWYYGLDGATEGYDVDVVAVLTHELAHGFGFGSEIDMTDGDFLFEPGVYDRFLYAPATNQSFIDMTANERLAALSTPHSLVWTGGHARRDAVNVLAPGLPRIFGRLPDGTPVLTSDLVGETEPAQEFSDVLAPLAAVSSTELCNASGDVSGRIALVDGALCLAEEKYLYAADLGALAVVIEDSADTSLSPMQIFLFDGFPSLPAFTVGAADYARLSELAAGSISVRLFRDPSRLVGADVAGRPYLETGAPIEPGSTLSHLDWRARRAVAVDGSFELLLEPRTVGAITTDMGLALSLLEDMGWGAPLCGDEELNDGEECDTGPDRSDHLPGACRYDCRLAACGDATVDPGEECDSGLQNSDEHPNTCRMSCRLPSCGDGVLDFLTAEACDDGASNGTSASECGTDCTLGGPLAAGGAGSGGASGGPSAAGSPGNGLGGEGQAGGGGAPGIAGAGGGEATLGVTAGGSNLGGVGPSVAGAGGAAPSPLASMAGGVGDPMVSDVALAEAGCACRATQRDPSSVLWGAASWLVLSAALGRRRSRQAAARFVAERRGALVSGRSRTNLARH